MPLPKLPGDDRRGYLVQIGDQTRGPLTAEGIESLAYLGQVTPETLIRREDEAAFVPLRTTALRAMIFPKFVEPSAPAAWSKPGPAAASSSSRNPLKFGAPKFERVNPRPGVGRKVEVTAILEEVRTMERNAGFDTVRENRFRIAKRTKDFWLLLLLGNGLLLGGAIFMGSLSSFVWAFGGMGLFTFGLLWSMFGVMGKY